MKSFKIEMQCVHCQKTFGVEFQEGRGFPIYFQVGEHEDKASAFSNLNQQAEDKYPHFESNQVMNYFNSVTKDVAVKCQVCSKENMVSVPMSVALDDSDHILLNIYGKGLGNDDIA